MGNVKAFAVYTGHRKGAWEQRGQRSSVSLPIAVILFRKGSTPVDALGAALVKRSVKTRPGRISISIVAHDLPEPDAFGPFDSYEGLAFIPDLITWRWPLEESVEPVATWAGTFTEITAELTPDTHIQVRPVNLSSGASGPVILSGTLQQPR